MKTMSWTGIERNKIELHAEYTTMMVAFEQSDDGLAYGTENKPFTRALLELWIDGKKTDSCWNINFWHIIDAQGMKKILGLPVSMTAEQAEKVEAFLADVIASDGAENKRKFEATFLPTGHGIGTSPDNMPHPHCWR